MVYLEKSSTTRRSIYFWLRGVKELQENLVVRGNRNKVNTIASGEVRDNSPQAEND